MSAERRKKRIIDANGKELYKLVVEYLFHIQNKPLKDVKAQFVIHNLKWVDRCRKFKRQLVDPNPSGFRIAIQKKDYVDTIMEKLSLDPPAMNWFQKKLFSYYLNK